MASRAKKLARFTVLPEAGSYQLHVEDDGGDTLELVATREQIELIADTLDDLLAQDDDLDEVGEEDEDED